MLREKQKYIYLAIAAIPVILLIWGITILSSSSYLGLDFEQKNGKWHISKIDKESPAAIYPELIGKEVVSIAGWGISHDDLQRDLDLIKTKEGFDHLWAANAHIYKNMQTGNPVVITVNDPAHPEYSITPIKGVPLSHLFFSDLWGITLTVFIYLFIGVSIIVKKPDNLAAKVFYGMSIVVSIFYICKSIYFNREIALEPNTFHVLWPGYDLFNMYAVTFATYFFVIFMNTPKIARNKIFPAIYFTVPLICFALDQSRVFYPVLKVTLLIYTLIGISFFIYNYFAVRSVTDKAAMRWLLVAMCTFVFISVVFGQILPLITGREYLDTNMMMLISLVFPVSLALSIIRYRLMDIDSLVDNTLIYVVTLILLALMDFVIISILVELNILEITSVFTLVLGVWFIILGYLPVRDMVQRYIKRTLKRGVYDMNEVSLLLSRELISVHSTKDAFARVGAILHRTLYPIGSSSHILGERGSIMMAGGSSDIPHIPMPIIETLGEPTPLYQITKPENLPNEYSGGILVPIRDYEKKHVGYFLLQNKESGRLYDKDDIRFLNLTASQLAMSIGAISAREKAILEKERLSKEIHDGVGTTLAQALIMSRNSNKYKPKDLQKLLAEGLEEMREMLWAVDKRESSLERTISHILDKLKIMEHSLPVESEIKLADGDMQLSPGVRINLTRIVQEAVNNVLQHSGAGKVFLGCVQQGDIIEITIRDEGAGFDTGEEVAPGHYGLGNMRRRSEEIGAQYSIVSEKGKGTTVIVKIDITK